MGPEELRDFMQGFDSVSAVDCNSIIGRAEESLIISSKPCRTLASEKGSKDDDEFTSKRQDTSDASNTINTPKQMKNPIFLKGALEHPSCDNLVHVEKVEPLAKAASTTYRPKIMPECDSAKKQVSK
jgi:hypothetical protein